MTCLHRPPADLLTSQSVFTKFEDPMVQMVHTPVLRSQASTQAALSRGLQQNLVKVTPSCTL